MKRSAGELTVNFLAAIDMSRNGIGRRLRRFCASAEQFGVVRCGASVATAATGTCRQSAIQAQRNVNESGEGARMQLETQPEAGGLPKRYQVTVRLYSKVMTFS